MPLAPGVHRFMGRAAIAETRISDTGAKALIKVIPGLKIHREPTSLEAPEILPPPLD
jgi:hypothetical protein